MATTGSDVTLNMKTASTAPAAPWKATVAPPTWVLLNPFAWVLWTLDLALWFAFLMPVKWVLNFIAEKGSIATGEAGVRRCRTALDKLATTPYPGVSTAWEGMARSFKLHADRPALAYRTYLGEIEDPDPSLSANARKKKLFGPTVEVSYGEMGVRAMAFGKGLVSLGMKPFAGNPEEFEKAAVAAGAAGLPSTLLIWEETSPQWSTAAFGCFSQSVVVATSYATLGIDAVANALNECGATTIMCNKKTIGKVLSIAGKCPTLTTIVWSGNYNTEEELAAPVPDGGNLTVIGFEEVIAKGKASSVSISPPKTDSIAVIMYTSGSTGQPKGVMLRHSNLTAALASVRERMSMLDDGKEVYLAYLPAAHILELIAEIVFFGMAAKVCYADPKTISSKGAARQLPDGTVRFELGGDHPPGAIQEYRPTVIAGVPKVWDTLKKGIEAKIGGGSPVIRFLFQTAYSARAYALSQGRECPLFALLPFKKVQGMLGGRLKATLSGGGAVSSETQTFCRTVLCKTMVQGYALTETASCGTIQFPTDARNRVVGPPLSSVEFKLATVDEVMDTMGNQYQATDTVHSTKQADGSTKSEPCAGRGEVWIRGPPVSAGYFRQPEKTAEAYVPDGQGGLWFRTGDIALWTPDGCIKIVDRVKNLVKLKSGEYVALEAMEREYGNSAYCSGATGGVWCYADDSMDRPIAVMQANMALLRSWLKSQPDMGTMTDVELCAHPDVNKLVLDDLYACAKKGGLSPIEKIAAVGLVSGDGDADVLTATSPWNPDNGALTASNKLSRNGLKTALASVTGPLMAKATR